MRLEISGSRANIVERETLVAGEVKVHIAEFCFGDSWDEYTVKLAVFKNGDVMVEMVIKDGVCVIPWEVLVSPGELYIGVRGESADKHRPTLWSEAVTVNEGTGEADASREPTPDVWQQLLAAIGDITPHIGENGNWFVGDVDTGTPAQGEKGEPGEKGDQGARGADGTDGKDGLDGKDGTDGVDGYTPVRGTDYFTESDKDEMVEAVLAALPNGDEVSY